MDSKQIAALCKETGIPFASEAWPKEVNLPDTFLIYDFEGTNNFYADGKLYQAIDQWSVTLFSKRREPETEKRVLKVFADGGITLGDAISERDEENNRRWTMWNFEVLA